MSPIKDITELSRGDVICVKNLIIPNCPAYVFEFIRFSDDMAIIVSMGSKQEFRISMDALAEKFEIVK